MRGQWIANLGLIAALIGCRSGSDSADETASTAPSPGGDAPGALAELAESPAGSTLPPPAALDELSPGLFGATEVGVPADWAILDLDPLVAEDLLGAPDADPFAGLLSCASGTLRDEEGAWLSRRFSAPGVPLGERLLTVELLLEIEDDDEFASNVAALMDCTAAEQATLERASGQLDLPEQPGATPALELALGSPPTARSRTRVPSTSSAPTTATARLR